MKRLNGRVLTTLFVLFVFAGMAQAEQADNCHSHTYFGEPGKEDQVLCRSGFAIGYHYATKTPGWVAYRLTAASVAFKFDRPDKVKGVEAFKEDTELPLEYRSTLEDFKNSGYDRGHMAPSATIDFSEIAMEESFLLSNIIPQDPEMNRGGWAALERYVRAWASARKDIWVVTGPIYHSKYLRIGNNVAVPNDFYLVIFDPVNQQMIAFLVPHKGFKREEIPSFIVSVDKVEDVTKYDFFNLLDNDYENALEKVVSPIWR